MYRKGGSFAEEKLEKGSREITRRSGGIRGKKRSLEEERKDQQKRQSTSGAGRSLYSNSKREKGMQGKKKGHYAPQKGR